MIGLANEFDVESRGLKVEDLIDVESRVCGDEFLKLSTELDLEIVHTAVDLPWRRETLIAVHNV